MTKSDAVSYFADTMVDYTRASRWRRRWSTPSCNNSRGCSAARLCGGGEQPATHIIGSKDEFRNRPAGTEAEENAIKTARFILAAKRRGAGDAPLP